MKKTTVVGAFVGVLFVVGVFIGFQLAAGQDDQKLIQEAVTEAVKASKEGRPGGVLENVSVELKVNDTSVGGAREISDVVKRFKPEVEIPPVQAKVFEDQAIISTPVKLSFGLLGAKQSFDLNNVTITMKREPDRKYLVIPSSKWRVAEVKVPADALPQGLPGL